MSLPELTRQRSSDRPGGNVTYIRHWGYGLEPVPCTGATAYCGYMHMYWKMHDLTMLYTFILWWVIAGLVVAVGAFRFWTRRRRPARSVDGEGRRRPQRGLVRAVRAGIAAARRRGLRQGFILGLFKGVTRVQITVLAMVVIYLIIFSFVGGTYNKVFQQDNRKHTELGWWSNRVGSLAFALTPLTLVLSMRENIFSLITAIPYQHFNFMHRMLGRIIFVQTLLHTVGWTIVQGHLYEPQTQPAYLGTQWKERYYQWGFIAQMLLAFLWVGTLSPVARWIGHEAFRKSHYTLAALYLGGCWGHWPQMKEWMIASIAVLFFDRGCRLLRMALIHCGMKSATSGFGFKSAVAETVAAKSDADGRNVVVLRLRARPLDYAPGQHFFLTFPSISLLQSHPFTPAVVNGDQQLYVIAGMAGETGRLVKATQTQNGEGIPVVLCGPYGRPVLDHGAEHFLLVAGGTGVSFTLPLLSDLVERRVAGKLRFVWVLRRVENLAWVRAELSALIGKALASKLELEVVLHITRDDESVSPRSEGKEGANTLERYAVYSRPVCREVVTAFVESTAGGGRSQVLASGPARMGMELRDAVAECNDAARVWKGEEAADVGMYWDSRYQR